MLQEIDLVLLLGLEEIVTEKIDTGKVEGTFKAVNHLFGEKLTVCHPAF